MGGQLCNTKKGAWEVDWPELLSFCLGTTVSKQLNCLNLEFPLCKVGMLILPALLGSESEMRNSIVS